MKYLADFVQRGQWVTDFSQKLSAKKSCFCQYLFNSFSLRFFLLKCCLSRGWGFYSFGTKSEKSSFWQASYYVIVELEVMQLNITIQELAFEFCFCNSSPQYSWYFVINTRSLRGWSGKRKERNTKTKTKQIQTLWTPGLHVGGQGGLREEDSRGASEASWKMSPHPTSNYLAKKYKHKKYK